MFQIGIIFCVFLSIHQTTAVWTCLTNQDCSILAGGICNEGACECPPGQQSIKGGTECVGVAPYHTSPCLEDHQCSRLFSNFECRRNSTEEVGACVCRDGFHYFLGRCWRTVGFGEPCSLNEECLDLPRDPYSLKCDGTCICADGYYEKQRGECRKYGSNAGDGCVLNEDCRFAGGSCNQNTFTCVSDQLIKYFTVNLAEAVPHSGLSDRDVDSVHNRTCGASEPCDELQVCSFGACVCQTGYYMFNETCYAELGSPSTPEQCDGLLAVVIDGICACRPNFFYDNNMRDCIKVSRNLTQDSCVIDSACHTYGVASRCGQPQDPWQLRNCECIPEDSVWDENQNMCRLFAGVGEVCQVDSDCLAGEIEINCVVDEQGVGYCRCPAHLVEVDGLCLTSGLKLGESCQATQECTGTEHTVCANGICSCGEGFQQNGDYCAPVIGGACVVNEDCVIKNTICSNGTDGQGLTCQCDDEFVSYDDECWTVAHGFEANCTVSAQCTVSLGEAALCADSQCVCTTGHHHRDGNCWPITELFAVCSRTSQCYLADFTERTVCRNGLCQCTFDYPFSDQLGTCVSSASGITASFVVVAAMLSVLL